MLGQLLVFHPGRFPFVDEWNSIVAPDRCPFNISHYFIFLFPTATGSPRSKWIRKSRRPKANTTTSSSLAQVTKPFTSGIALRSHEEKVDVISQHPFSLDNGKVIKAVRTDSQPVVIEEIQVFPLTVPVTNMMIHRGKSGADGSSEEARLVVSSQSEIASLKLQRCYSDKVSSCRYFNFLSFSCWLLLDYVAKNSTSFLMHFSFVRRSECVKLRDPYCAWDKRKQKCVAVGSWTIGANLFQNVATGVHESCPETHGKSMVKSPPSRDNNAGYVASSSGVAEASLFNADFPAPASSSSSSSSSTPARGGKSFATHSHVAEVADGDKDDGDMEAGMDPNLDLDDDDVGGGIRTNSDGPRIAPDESQPKYTVETLAIAVAAGSLAALFLGFVLGYCCGRKCRKNEEDNMPYPDTEYEYFEQRQNCHMRRYKWRRIYGYPSMLSVWDGGGLCPAGMSLTRFLMEFQITRGSQAASARRGYLRRAHFGADSEQDDDADS